MGTSNLWANNWGWPHTVQDNMVMYVRTIISCVLVDQHPLTSTAVQLNLSTPIHQGHRAKLRSQGVKVTTEPSLELVFTHSDIPLVVLPRLRTNGRLPPLPLPCPSPSSPPRPHHPHCHWTLWSLISPSPAHWNGIRTQ